MLSIRLLLPKRPAALLTIGNNLHKQPNLQSNWQSNWQSNLQPSSQPNCQSNRLASSLVPGGVGDPYKTTIKRKAELPDPNRPKFVYNEAMESLKWANWHTLKDLKKRCIASEYHPRRLCLHYVYKYKSLPFELREHALNVTTKEMPRKSQWRSGRLRYHCILTGRPRGRVMRYRVSRFWFRHLADYNKLSGVIKGKW